VSEADFPKLLEYCPSAEASLLIDDDSHYLFCYTSDQNGDGINLIICVIFSLVYLHNSNNNKSSSADKVT